MEPPAEGMDGMEAPAEDGAQPAAAEDGGEAPAEGEAKEAAEGEGDKPADGDAMDAPGQEAIGAVDFSQDARMNKMIEWVADSLDNFKREDHW